MKPENAVEVENLSKLYHVGAEAVQRPPLQALWRGVTSPIARTRRVLQRKSAFASDEALWALKDVTFNVQQGEVLAVIGANGSGKSTLLKILSRVTHPTTGQVRIRGAVGALLEVGTGFHPELTGRENIYLNASVLGVKRSEVERMFTDIVEFSGIGEFLDTPLKRYSSGMRVRLAFSVAVHLQPEIVLIDEVLSVGDTGFRRASIDKIAALGKQGRTVIIVNHNLQALQQLSERALLLKRGVMVEDGSIDQVIETYLSQYSTQTQTVSTADLLQVERHNNVVSDDVRFTRCVLLDENDQPVQSFEYGQPLRFLIEAQAKRFVENLDINLVVYTRDGARLTSISSADYGKRFDIVPEENLRVLLEVDQLILLPGVYGLGLSMREHVGLPFDSIKNALHFEVLPLRHDETLPLNKTGMVGTKAVWRLAAPAVLGSGHYV